MKPERWREVDKLLEAALERETSQRADFLKQACSGDEELQREVESLLAVEGEVGSFMKKPADEMAARGLAQDASLSLPGQQLGSYQILSLLGRGGMGEVYRAEDTVLKRQVAIKFLPAEFAYDVERLARFEREARLLASLNHPNIATIHSLEKAGERRFIVEELVEGQTLVERLTKGALPVQEALEICHQVAEGLEAAHEKGIIHRDLKPANIKFTREGKVKILDLGLGKVLEKETPETEDSPTVTATMTGSGVILGTAAYMSPEQARGERVDRRTDIWSFGCVLYELLTGRRAFGGESSAETLAKVLETEPDLDRLPKNIAPSVRALLSRCLRKDPQRRLRDIRDVSIEIEDALAETVTPVSETVNLVTDRKSRTWIWLGLSGLGIVIAVLTVWSFWLSSPPDAPLKEVPLTSYPGQELYPSFSPDGNQIAFSWNGEQQDNFDIYIQQIGITAQHRLTSHPNRDYSPTWSPDGRFIAFLRELNIDRSEVLMIPALGGPERSLGEVYAWLRQERGPFLTWSPDSKSILASDKDSAAEPFGLFLLSIDKNERRRLTSPPLEGRATADGDSAPSFSPGGSFLAFSRAESFFAADVYVLRLSSDLSAVGEPKRVTFKSGPVTSPVWSSDGSEIIFCSASFGNWALWRILTTGFEPPQPLPSVGSGAQGVAISHQGRRLAYTRSNQDSNIWRVEVPSLGERPKQPPAKFISSTRDDLDPHYSPDGKRIVFDSDRSGHLEVWVCNSDNSGQIQLTSLEANSGSARWSPDGKRLAFDSAGEGKTQIYVINANGGQLQRLSDNPAMNIVPNWSKDGQWIYFSSNRGGEYQVWKMPAQDGELVQVTKKGGMFTAESPDGRFLYYTSGEDPKTLAMTQSLWRVPVGGGEESLVLKSINPWNFAVLDQGIYFTPEPLGARNSSIRFLNLATGTIERIADTEAAGIGLTASPDGRSILYTQVDQEGSDLMLVENFH